MNAARLCNDLGLALVLASCAMVPPPAPIPDPGIEAAWVVLGEDGAAIARVVTTAAECPELFQDGVPRRMAVRAAPRTVAQRKTASADEDSKPSAFPALACESELAKDARFATVGKRALPMPSAAPERIVVVGDTGCRLKKSDSEFQSCDDASAWAAKATADAAAAFKPDLVVHVGDYHYRENRCPAGNAGCAGSAWGYGWDTWKEDFFSPSRALLGAAPWVMVRGNHESCRRAGQGWWRFLDPRPLQAGRDCNLAEDDARGDYSAPYRVSLGGGAQLIVLDSSNAPLQPFAAGEPPLQIYRAQLEQANRLAAQATTSIFVMHHPILGFAPVWQANTSLEAYGGNPALQAIMRDLNGKRLFPANVPFTIAGHVHLFEAIGFSSGHPAQLVSGNGGTSLDSALPATLSPATTPYPEAVVDSFISIRDYGYMTIERLAQSWQVKAWDNGGRVLAACALANEKLTCERGR